MRLGMPVAIYGTICQLRELNGVSIRTDNGNTLDVPCGCLHKLVAEPEETGEKKPVYGLLFHEATRLMSEGYVLEREAHYIRHRIKDGFIECLGYAGWERGCFDEDDLNSKWRVVTDDELTERE